MFLNIWVPLVPTYFGPSDQPIMPFKLQTTRGPCAKNRTVITTMSLFSSHGSKQCTQALIPLIAAALVKEHELRKS